MKAWAFTFWVVFSPVLVGANYYVSPTGTGIGTLADPIALSNALSSAVSPAQAGDTIWLRGGAYAGVNCTLSAPSNNPIVVRQYPGERAIVDVSSSALAVNGSGVWLWGFEVMASNTNRYAARNDGVGMSTSAAGSHNKLINLTIHDTGDGVFDSYQSTNAEIYGCVIYNVGYQLSDRGHGHDLYVQNRNNDFPKLVAENIGLNSFSGSVNLRSSGDTYNIDCVGNVIVDPGSNSTNGWAASFHTEGDRVDGILLAENFSYFPVQAYGGGFNDLSTNGTITMVSNVWANSYSQIFYWTNVVFNGNIQFVSVDIRIANTNYTTADYNTYYKVVLNVPILYDQTNLTLAQWQSSLGNDLHGTATAIAPTGKWIYVRPNKYESGRANIIIYNWDKSDNVSVDVSSVLPVGAAYAVRNAADYAGNPVLSGTYGGGSISLPMTNLTVAVPIGMASAPTNTAPEFNVFVLNGSIPTPRVEIQSATIGTALFQ